MCNEMMADMGINDMMDKGMSMMRKGMSMMGSSDKAESADASKKNVPTESSDTTIGCNK